jgi:hypothetical protein
MVGMVVTISPNLSLYKIVVLPAASRPTYKVSMRTKNFAKKWGRIINLQGNILRDEESCNES